MIDIESDVYKIVRDAAVGVMGEGKVDVSGVYSKDPAHFPFVSVVETDNSTYQQMRTSDVVDNFVNVTYDVNVYSNRQATKKSECKAIIAAIDEALLGAGFVRLSLNQTPNLLDATVFRMTARYRATVDRNRRIYYRR